MDLDLIGTPARFESLQPGTIFAFGLRDQNLIAIKTIERAPDGREGFGAAVILPGHPELGKPGFFLDTVVSHYLVLALDGVRLSPSRDLTHWVMGRGISPGAGDLVITPSRTLMCIGTGRADVTFDVQTGEITSPAHDNVPMLVHNWSLVREYFGRAEIVGNYSR
jgi:hypothetical protein